MSELRKRVAEQLGALMLANIELAVQLEEAVAKAQAKPETKQSETQPAEGAQ